MVGGASGLLGGKIAHRLLERGEEVRALVRDSASVASLTAAGVEPIDGDLKDPASLQAACEGATTLVTTANSVQRGGEDTVETVDLRGNAALIDAAEAAGVERFVYVSSLSADTASPVPFLAAKGALKNGSTPAV